MAEFALRLENGTDTAPRVRLGEAAVRFPAGSLAARGGLRPDGGGEVTVVAGTMDVSVSPLLAYVNGGSSSTQGGYPFVLDAAKTLTLSDGDGALSRTDTIAVVVNETAYDGSGSTDAAVVVVEGTPGAGAPALPPSAVALRDVTVPAGLSAGTGGLASGNLSTDRRVYTVAAGGVLPVASVTERDALAAVEGMVVYRRDIDELQTFDGTSWTADPDSGWITPAYQNGWSARDGSPAYRRLNGVVYLRGRLQRGSYNGAAAFTLPAGYRPAQTMYFSSPAGNGYGRVEVDTAGRVVFDSAGATPGFQSVSGVCFPV